MPHHQPAPLTLSLVRLLVASVFLTALLAAFASQPAIAGNIVGGGGNSHKNWFKKPTCSSTNSDWKQKCSDGCQCFMVQDAGRPPHQPRLTCHGAAEGHGALCGRICHC
ncbi:hypothetical protein DFJ73DRAFT_793743 [Zopfochytrium polystomum]|nr:hypothetical protein DFJ73DRAFT_793743 [Zopfochytrium polystomum]